MAVMDWAFWLWYKNLELVAILILDLILDLILYIVVYKKISVLIIVVLQWYRSIFVMF